MHRGFAKSIAEEIVQRAVNRRNFFIIPINKPAKVPIEPSDYDYNIDEAFYQDELYDQDGDGDYIPSDDLDLNEEEEELDEVEY